MCFALFAKLLAGAKVSDFILEPSVKKLKTFMSVLSKLCINYPLMKIAAHVPQ